ncbi:MAG: twin-arginine translocase subunit TatC [Chloroflexota bacterium]|nr:twin-arginine translocase subunit TatC [Chloroflexota bacterium]
MARALKRPNIKLPKLPRLPDPSEPDVFEEMTLLEHMIELRDRIMKMVIAIGIAFIAGLFLSGRVLETIRNATNSSGEGGLDIRSPSDPLTLYMKVALYIAIGIAAPVIIYQIVGFLAPGLTKKEKRLVYTSLPFVSLLFIAGVSYSFFFAIPRALAFLSNFMTDIWNYQPDGNETLSFYLAIMLGLGLAFQLPLVMFLLAKLGIVTPQNMRKGRRYAYLVILLAAAIITPTTDPFNMALVALPLVALYEIGIILAAIFARGSVPRNPTPTPAD